MTPDEYWNADPELAAAYRKAEQLRVQKKQQELWCEGLYMMRAIGACLSKDVSYFEEPLPTTKEEVTAREVRNQALAKARFEQWAFMSKGGDVQ